MYTVETDNNREAKHELAQIESLLSNVSSKALKKRIENFNDNYKHWDSSDIYEQIKNVIMVQMGAIRAGAFTAQEKEYLPGGIFYRARVWYGDFGDLPESEFWAAPDEFIKSQGRINRSSQGLLYTSEGQIPTTFAEVRATLDSKILLMAYQAKEALNVATVGSKFYSDLSSNAKKKLSLIRKFINNNLLAAGQSAYLFSSEFANSFLSLSPDGWGYPSTLYPGGENVCFRTESQHKLELLEVFAFDGKENAFEAPVGYFTPQENGTYKYHSNKEEAALRFSAFIMEHRRLRLSNDCSTLEQRRSVHTTTKLIL